MSKKAFTFDFLKKDKPAGASGTTEGSTPSTTSSSTTSTTTSTTAPKFNFTQTKTNSTSSSGAKQDQPITIPPELKNKKVKEIIETMESQLEQQARQFQTQARQIARWDRYIYDTLELMMFLEKQIKSVDSTQKELSASAKSLLQDQENFLATLKEKNASNKNDDSLTESDQRAKLYATAKKLGEEFHYMESELKKIVEKTENNESQDSISDIDKVIQISNCHLDSLQWISNSCASIEEKLSAIENQVH